MGMAWILLHSRSTTTSKFDFDDAIETPRRLNKLSILTKILSLLMVQNGFYNSCFLKYAAMRRNDTYLNRTMQMIFSVDAEIDRSNKLEMKSMVVEEKTLRPLEK